MNKFKYRIYYKYLGPSKDDPFATKPLTSVQVQDGIDKLRAILPDHFSTITKDNSLFVTVTTSNSEHDTTTALNRCVAKLNRSTPGLSLLGEKLFKQ
jgi:hypothetical protein